MYEVFSQVIGAPADADPVLVAGCCVLCIVLIAVFIDLIRDIFSGFFRG